ncbi:hypothetical protein ACFLXO_06000 [Chloroflexota bacterium]
MIERTTNPDKFAAWFNSVVPGAYRKITAQDTRDMTECGLIKCYGGYFSRVDLETVRALLRYEQMREKRSAQEALEYTKEPAKCKMCGQSLPPEPEDKAGRPKEYCSECESFRNNERQKKRRRRHRKHFKPAIT